MKALQRVLTALSLIGAGLIATAEPALATGTCATAADMVPGSTQMGPTAVRGTTGTFEPSDWWRHTGTPSPRSISVTSDQPVDLFVHRTCGGPAVCDRVQSCSVAGSGDIFIEVRLRLTSTAANYTLTVTPPPPTECSDGRDNDADGRIDFPADPHCTSLSDPTEAAVRTATWGGVMFGIDTTQSPMTMTLLRTGVFTTDYTCVAQWAPIGVVCTANPNPNIQWVCSTMPLMAEAPQRIGTATSQLGFVVGTVQCDDPPVVRTAEVIGTGRAVTSNTQQGVTLGTADRVVCSSAGVTARPAAEGSFSVACGPFDPGVEWPYGPSPLRGDEYGDAVVEVLRSVESGGDGSGA